MTFFAQTIDSYRQNSPQSAAGQKKGHRKFPGGAGRAVLCGHLGYTGMNERETAAARALTGPAG
jgi:hypothetical protein